MEIAGTTLAITTGFTAAHGDTFRIIINDGTDKVKGTFTNLPEGCAFAWARSFQIIHRGGTGNDVTLTALVHATSARTAETRPTRHRRRPRNHHHQRRRLRQDNFVFNTVAAGRLPVAKARSGAGRREFADPGPQFTAKAPTGDGRVNASSRRPGLDLGKVTYTALGRIAPATPTAPPPPSPHSTSARLACSAPPHKPPRLAHQQHHRSRGTHGHGRWKERSLP